MITYYAHRAAEYERVYASPRWQDDLEQIRGRILAVLDRPRLDRLIGPHATGLTYQELPCFSTLEYAVA
jgi:hypothetical protein